MTREPTAVLRIRLPDEAAAKTVMAALKPDDDAYVTTRLEASTVVVECRAPDVAGLRRAVDDVLAGLGVSEDVLGASPLDG